MSRQFFTAGLSTTDPLVADALAAEDRRQRSSLELIASENIVSRAVLEALGHAMTNKTLEGYPGSRFHGGGEHVDTVETAAIERAHALRRPLRERPAPFRHAGEPGCLLHPRAAG